MKRYYRRVRLVFDEDPLTANSIDSNAIFKAPVALDNDCSTLFGEVELFPIDLGDDDVLSTGSGDAPDHVNHAVASQEGDICVVKPPGGFTREHAFSCEVPSQATQSSQWLQKLAKQLYSQSDFDPCSIWILISYDGQHGSVLDCCSYTCGNCGVDDTEVG